MNKRNIFRQNIQSAIDLKQQLLSDEALAQKVEQVVEIVIGCFEKGGKVLFCGNGGSAADAQHLSTELSGRYYYDRPPLFAEALHGNTSYMTAVANDYDFGEVYARQLKAMGRAGDVLIGLSTSGNSENVCRAVATAKSIKMTTIAFTGAGGGRLQQLADLLLEIPSKDTPRIQECHMLLGHAICQMVEGILFPRE
ncbi:MAG: SIS domain-containing protein [Bacteroidota bacterium]